jgi:hypothetical protein
METFWYFFQGCGILYSIVWRMLSALRAKDDATATLEPSMRIPECEIQEKVGLDVAFPFGFAGLAFFTG